MTDQSGEQAPDTVSATFMFADIAGFTALTEAHGDQEAAKLVGEFCEAVAAELPAFGGTQVKTIGDALMLRIPDPGTAVLLGLRIAHDILQGHGAPAVRVGMHHGPAIERAGDYIGSTVNLAARVSAAATGGEVLLTARTAATAPQVEGVLYQSRGRQTLRNVRDPVELVAAVRQGDTSDRGLAIDPVCRMAVDPRARRRTAHLRGHDVLLLHPGLCGGLRAPPATVRQLTSSAPTWSLDERRSP